jgi:hypothetical protein
MGRLARGKRRQKKGMFVEVKAKDGKRFIT